MSADGEADGVMCCASCGRAEVDDVELKDCDGGCDLVKYCSDKCQDNNREQHEEECKQRKTELRDKDLFTMPEGRQHGDCPICCLPLPIDPSNKSTFFMSCCSQIICGGCNHAHRKCDIEAGLRHRCAFCREPAPKSKEEANKRIMKRIKENNDPAAMCHMGKKCYFEGDYKTALKYYTKAAELGEVDAHHYLSIMYGKGRGVEKDKKKEVYHLEEAAIGGHPMARCNLGIKAWNNATFDSANPNTYMARYNLGIEEWLLLTLTGFDRARKHFIIAANLGYHDSLQPLKDLYAKGHASKEDYANALRAYQAAVDAAKSPEREAAEAYYSSRRR